MARTFAAVAAFALLAGSLCAFDDTPAVGTDEITSLVKQLGDDDYDTREAAEKRLAVIGDPALPALREASNSGNPEIARRANRLAARLTYRVDNNKNLAPTLVTLDCELLALRDVLAALTKQLSSDSKYPISLNMDTASDRASKKITVKMEKVPFWTALLAVCDAADLRIHSVGGFIAPDSRDSNAPSLPVVPSGTDTLPLPNGQRLPNPSLRPTPGPQPTTAGSIILTPRNGAPRRPSAVYGAVCVEAIKMPDGTGVPESAAALLNVWPEPKLNWIETSAVKLECAEDDVGQLLAGVANAPTGIAPQVIQQGNVVFVKQVNGNVQIMNPNANVPLTSGLQPFVPSIRQTVVKLKPGKRVTTQLTELRGSLFGTVRSGTEPLVTLKGLEGGKSFEAAHPAGVQVKASLTQNNAGKWTIVVDVYYDRAKVQPANEPFTVQGIRIADASGKSFGLSMTSSQGMGRGDSTWVRQITTFQLYAANGATGDPSAITFLGTYPKPVEVPFILAGVPIVGGRK